MKVNDTTEAALQATEGRDEYIADLLGFFLLVCMGTIALEISGALGAVWTCGKYNLFLNWVVGSQLWSIRLLSAADHLVGHESVQSWQPDGSVLGGITPLHQQGKPFSSPCAGEGL